MRQRLSLILTLAAWLLATGSHWDLVQTYAWGRMIATYSQTMSFRAAVRLTFTPDNMCGVCHVVADARQQAADTAAVPGGKVDTKVLLVFAPVPAPVVAAPDLSRWSRCDCLTPPAERSAPPLPPPRVLAA